MIVRDYDFNRHTIQDPIHGGIAFGVIEKAIIDHQLFQRLHGLRQNSLLYLVFPSANHTRFDHSVGVMFLADKLLSAILKNQEYICQAGASRSSYQDPYRVDDNAIAQTVNLIGKDQYYRIALRSAALFHDIGHGPLSHLFDKFFPSWSEMKDLASDPDYSHILARLQSVTGDEANKRIPHEVLSCAIATRIILDSSQHLEPYGIDPHKMAKDVCGIIDDGIGATSQLQAGEYNAKAFFHDVLSSDLDVDRMDYLLRDSHMCGVNYGLYDPDRILKSMCSYGLKNEGILRVGVRYSGLGAIEDLLIARYQMHGQIYGHKTNRASNAMLEQIRRRLDEAKWKWYRGAGSFTELLQIFSSFDDQKFIQDLRSEAIDGGKRQVKEIAEKLFIERRLYKRVFEARSGPGISGTHSTAENRWKDYVAKLEENGIQHIPDEFQNKGPRLDEDNYPLKVLRKDPREGYYIVHDFRDLSSLAHCLPQKESIYRVYCKQKYVVSAKRLLPASVK